MALIILDDGVDIIGPEGEFIWMADLGMHVTLDQAIAYNNAKYGVSVDSRTSKRQASKPEASLE